MLTQSTVSHYVKKGDVGMSPKSHSPSPMIPWSILKLIGTHVSMLQASTGKATPRELKATLQASVAKTKYQTINMHYVWEKQGTYAPNSFSHQQKCHKTTSEASGQHTRTVVDGLMTAIICC